MNYEIVLPESFKESIRRLKRKFPKADSDVKIALNVLLENPFLGVVISGGRGVRKLRVRNSDLQRGKSGGYRLVYFLDGKERRIYPLLIYSKTEQEDVSKQELLQLLQDLNK